MQTVSWSMPPPTPLLWVHPPVLVVTPLEATALASGPDSVDVVVVVELAVVAAPPPPPPPTRPASPLVSTTTSPPQPAWRAGANAAVSPRASANRTAKVRRK